MSKRKRDVCSDSSEDSDSDSPGVRVAATPDNFYSCTRTAEEVVPGPSRDLESKLSWFDRLPKTSAGLLYPLTAGSANAEDLLKIEAVMNTNEFDHDITIDMIKREAARDRVIVNGGTASATVKAN